MLFPDYNEFARLSQNVTLVPVVKTLPADLLTPVAAFLALAKNEQHAFLLESVAGGENVGRYTFLGIHPYKITAAKDDRLKIIAGKKTWTERGNILTVLQQELNARPMAHLSGLPPFTSGTVGFFAYDFARQLEPVGRNRKCKDDLKLPDCTLMFFDRLLAFDHVKQQLQIIATVDVAGHGGPKQYAAAIRDIEEIEQKLANFSTKIRTSARPSKITIRPRTSKAEFVKAVRAAKDYIAAGDVFQAVLSQRLEVEIKTDPFQVYRALRRVNPSPYMYFLKMGDLTVVGSSPEMLVKVAGRKLEYRPIAGTRWRGKDDAEDLRLEQEMRGSEKERAEHIMLVDLGRNDLGRVSEYGSVKVRDLMFVERYSHVMHLVSSIEGKLRPELTAVDAFAACFPAGTLTGAPKIRAMQIIEELEPVRRGIYGGSVLYADFAGNLDSCIAIRTMVIKGNKAYLQVGAGIVADSDPEAEYEECLNKSKAVVRAIELANSQ